MGMGIHYAAALLSQVIDDRKLFGKGREITTHDGSDYFWPNAADDSIGYMGNIDRVQLTHQQTACDECNAAERQQTRGIHAAKLTKCGHVREGYRLRCRRSRQR